MNSDVHTICVFFYWTASVVFNEIAELQNYTLHIF